MKRLLVVLLLLGCAGFGLDRQPGADYHQRRQALAAKLNGGVAIVFAATEAEGPNAIYGFRQDDNFFYLTGWAEPDAAVLIAPEMKASGDNPGHPYTEILFLPAHNYIQENWTGPKLGPENPQAASLTGFDHVESLDQMREHIAEILPQPRATVYADLPAYGETSTASEALHWLSRSNAFTAHLTLEDVKPLLTSLRTYKDAGELERIRKATDASVAAHRAAMRAVHPGITEREIAALLQYEWGKRGCERPAYAPIVGSGFNSTLLHYSQDSATMKDGDVVVIDAAGEYAMYASDITRTLPVNGRFTARQREIYDIVLGAQRAAIAAFKPGKSTLRRGDDPDSLYRVAYDYINTHGKSRTGEPLGKYFIHGLSHHVGLNVHDSGDYDVPIGPGMVFTIEPGIYIPAENLGVRIEDVFYVDPSGKLVNLSEALPRTAEDVEQAMAH